MWLPRYQLALQKELRRQVFEYGQAIVETNSIIPAERFIERWEARLVAVKDRFVYAMVQEGFELADKEMGRMSLASFLYEGHIHDAWSTAMAVPGWDMPQETFEAFGKATRRNKRLILDHAVLSEHGVFTAKAIIGDTPEITELKRQIRKVKRELRKVEEETARKLQRLEQAGREQERLRVVKLERRLAEIDKKLQQAATERKRALARRLDPTKPATRPRVERISHEALRARERASISSVRSATPPTTVTKEEFTFTLRHDPVPTEQWIADTSRLESQTSARRIGRYVEDELSQLKPRQAKRGIIYFTGGDVRSIGRALTNAKLADADPRISTRARSLLMARTGTIWSYNEGAKLRYQRARVGVMQWVAAGDDVMCDFCGDMDGQKITTGTPFLMAGDSIVAGGGVLDIPFNMEHPPLHPNCRCAVVPVI
jgi:hypothetical protein